MSRGQGSIERTNRTAGVPFPANSARNGLSVDSTGHIVLGQNVGAVGAPAALLNNREIPLAGFFFEMTQGGNRRFLIDPTADTYAIGDIDTAANGFQLIINDAASTWRLGQVAAQRSVVFHDLAVSAEMVFVDSTGVARLLIPNAAGGITQLVSDDFVSTLQLANAANGSSSILGQAGARFFSADNSGTNSCIIDNGVVSIFRAAQAQTNYAGVGAGTIANAPHAGNPDKWVAFNDAGTLRKFPTWI